MIIKNNNELVHGVLLNIFDAGVLITGKPGIGKSELALTLIDRGHKLVADDLPQFSSPDSKTVIGSCPELLQGFLEVRSLGLLNIRNLFGDKAIQQQTKLDLIVSLSSNCRGESMYSSTEINNIKIPQISLTYPIISNPAVIIETAVRNFLAEKKGYDAKLDFIAKQNKLLQQQT